MWLCALIPVIVFELEKHRSAIAMSHHNKLAKDHRGPELHRHHWDGNMCLTQGKGSKTYLVLPACILFLTLRM